MKTALIVFAAFALLALANYRWYRVEGAKPDNVANLGSLIPGLIALGFGTCAAVALFVILIKWIAS